MEQTKPTEFPQQHQERQPGIEHEMEPAPDVVALITGGDSGIGRAVAVHYAREGADVAIAYLDEHDDAETTKAWVEREGRRCLLLSGDVSTKSFCERAVEETVETFGGLDVLVNNAAVQFVRQNVEEISEEQLDRTFRTNIYAHFFMVQAARPHLKEGSAIINTTSITAFEGNPLLLDYSSTKGAILSFTRALAQHLVKDGIRVNAVAPGPIWTPLIPASFPEEQVATFGQDTPMGRPATCFSRPATLPTSPGRRCIRTADRSSARKRHGRRRARAESPSDKRVSFAPPTI